MTSENPPVGSALPDETPETDEQRTTGVASRGDNRLSREWGEGSNPAGEGGADERDHVDQPGHLENPASPASPVTSSSISAPKPPVTGDRAVDEAMELVSDAFGADLDFQLEAYESAHQTLQDRLADVES